MVTCTTQKVIFAVEITKDDYTPLPDVSDAFDISICTLCNTIGRKLKAVGYTILDMKSIWRRSRQNAESIEILCDLTGLKDYEVCYSLGLNKDTLSQEDVGISDYWARSPKTT